MLKGFVLGIIAVGIVAAASVYGLVESGAIPANADATPGPIEKWLARTDLRAVLRHESPTEPNPVALTDAHLIAGIQLYASHCVVCHGTAAGNASISPIGKGEYPAPPQLGSNGVEDDPEGWTYWKIKHGIRWTGMPSWKYELNDTEIWTLALFLKHMDHLSAGAKAAWQQVRQPMPLRGEATAQQDSSFSKKSR